MQESVSALLMLMMTAMTVPPLIAEKSCTGATSSFAQLFFFL